MSRRIWVPKRILTFKQIAVASCAVEERGEFSSVTREMERLYGLDMEGHVYEWDQEAKGWTPVSMNEMERQTVDWWECSTSNCKNRIPEARLKECECGDGDYYCDDCRAAQEVVS